MIETNLQDVKKPRRYVGYVGFALGLILFFDVLVLIAGIAAGNINLGFEDTNYRTAYLLSRLQPTLWYKLFPSASILLPILIVGIIGFRIFTVKRLFFEELVPWGVFGFFSVCCFCFSIYVQMDSLYPGVILRQDDEVTFDHYHYYVVLYKEHQYGSNGNSLPYKGFYVCRCNSLSTKCRCEHMAGAFLNRPFREGENYFDMPIDEIPRARFEVDSGGKTLSAWLNNTQYQIHDCPALDNRHCGILGDTFYIEEVKISPFGG